MLRGGGACKRDEILPWEVSLDEMCRRRTLPRDRIDLEAAMLRQGRDWNEARLQQCVPGDHSPAVVGELQKNAFTWLEAKGRETERDTIRQFVELAEGEFQSRCAERTVLTPLGSDLTELRRDDAVSPNPRCAPTPDFLRRERDELGPFRGRRQHTPLRHRLPSKIASSIAAHGLTQDPAHDTGANTNLNIKPTPELARRSRPVDTHVKLVNGSNRVTTLCFRLGLNAPA